MKVFLHPAARRELIAAALYLEHKAGVGENFLQEFEHWLAHVRELSHRSRE